MHWEDDAILLSVHKFSERDAAVSAFTRAHGIYRALAKGAFSKDKRGIYQPGNLVHMAWNARLPEHMGTARAEVLAPLAAHIMQDAEALCAMNSAFSLMHGALMERDPHPLLYDRLLHVLQELTMGGDWLADYVYFEFVLLAECGFGLDLLCCAATGSRENLVYVSPKSGRAVSAEAGEPYRERMLPLPAFLRVDDNTKNAPKYAEILDGLRLTGYFIEQWMYAPRGKKMPDARHRLTDRLMCREAA